MLTEKNLTTGFNKIRRREMSRKAKSRTGKPRPLVNGINLGLTDRELVVSANCKRGAHEERLRLSVDGSISTKAAIRWLELIISYLERKGADRPAGVDGPSPAAPSAPAEDPA
jgi:hypothetical protein